MMSLRCLAGSAAESSAFAHRGAACVLFSRSISSRFPVDRHDRAILLSLLTIYTHRGLAWLHVIWPAADSEGERPGARRPHRADRPGPVRGDYADPREGIAYAARIDTVIKGGRVIDRGALDLPVSRYWQPATAC